MSVQLILRKDQLDDLSTFRDLNPKTIKEIVDKLSGADPFPIKPSDLHQLLDQVMPEDHRKTSIILRQLVSLYTLMQQRHLPPRELLEALKYGIDRAETKWKQTEINRWSKIEPYLTELLSLQAVWNVVKATDLSYDYTNLFQTAKVLTDIRPVFNEKGSSIEGAVIAYTLRLYFDSLEGKKNLSIALDESDVRHLLQTCERALKKAKTAKRFMQNKKKGNINNTFIVGEEE